MKKLISIMLTTVLLLSLTACHGSQEQKVFEIPNSFDTSRNYEISFWAKNDTNMTQVEIYKKLSQISSLYIPILPSTCGFTVTTVRYITM